MEIFKRPTYEELENELLKAGLYTSIVSLLSQDIMTKDNLNEAQRLIERLKDYLKPESPLD